MGWDYLELVLKRLGFHPKWVVWLMECVKMVTFSITINGEAGDTLQLSRGIRQGCPLSAYLFLLCSKGLTALFNDYVSKQLMHGFRVNRHCPVISHLLFADDSIIYCQATNRDCEALHDVLAAYESASGQKVNKGKSSVLFSPNTTPETRSHLSVKVGISLEAQDAKYLGLPIFLGHSKRELFSYVKDQVVKRLRNWKDSDINHAGREVAIKSVLIAQPCYTMSCFCLPKTLLQQMSAEIAKFWWGSKEGECKIHRIKWEKLSRCKGDGGMGFRDLVAFNRALLAKQGWKWKLVSGVPFLFRSFFKGRYFPNTSFWHAPMSNQSSWA